MQEFNSRLKLRENYDNSQYTASELYHRTNKFLNIHNNTTISCVDDIYLIDRSIRLHLDYLASDERRLLYVELCNACENVHMDSYNEFNGLQKMHWIDYIADESDTLYIRYDLIDTLLDYTQ